ncbi:MAG TPA: hypothetical protein PLQ11_00605 [Beijerinckiaceae bacterium]|nr:hypothetical protein [Beijerinckiaceae bacterium]
MAGGGSGEEENYWPGFVDALTTMTMVLTFIMMILGVVIFSMSDKISKIMIKQIAEAAKIDISGGGSLDEVRDKIVAALKAQHREKSSAEDTDKITQFPLRGDSYAAPQPASPNTGRTKLPSPVPNAINSDGKLAGNTASEQPLAGQHDEKKVAPPPSPEDRDPNKIEPDRRIEASTINEVAQKASGVTLSGDGAVLTVSFEKRVVQLDDAKTQEFRSVVNNSNAVKTATKLEVRGYADVSVIGVTEARRIAYYRAMLIRKQLMMTGIDPERIAVRIEDGASADGDLVKVFAK